jgi:hypothetical protein
MYPSPLSIIPIPSHYDTNRQFCLARCSSMRTSGNAAYSSPFPSSTSNSGTDCYGYDEKEVATRRTVHSSKQVAAPVTISQTSALTYNMSPSAPPKRPNRRHHRPKGVVSADDGTATDEEPIPKREPYFEGGSFVIANVTNDNGVVHTVQYSFHTEDDDDSISVWCHDLTTGVQLWSHVAVPESHKLPLPQNDEEENKRWEETRELRNRVGHVYSNGVFAPAGNNVNISSMDIP